MIYINFEEAVEYRDQALIPFAETIEQELRGLVTLMRDAREVWYDDLYIRACNVINDYNRAQTDFLENYCKAMRNLNDFLYSGLVGYLGREFCERSYEMNSIPSLPVDAPGGLTYVESPQELYDIGKKIFDYSTRLKEDMSRLYRNHSAMNEYWRGTQYDQFTDLLYEMEQTVNDYVDNLGEVSRQVGIWANHLAETLSVDLRRDATFERHFNVQL